MSRIKSSLDEFPYCQKLTTEHTEKLFYFGSAELAAVKKLTEILLPPLCVLSIIILFLPLLVFTPVKFISSLPLRPALQKSSVPIPSYAINRIHFLGYFH